MTKRPALTRRPSGFTPETERAVLATLAAANVTSTGLAALLDGDADAEGFGAATEWSGRFKTVAPAHAWWAQARVEAAAAQKAELDAGMSLIDDGDDSDYATDLAGFSGSSDLMNAYERLRNRYVYASFRDEVWDRRARAWLKTRAMDNLEAHAMPVNDKGHRISAFALLRTDARAARVHNERYLPSVENELVERDGVAWLNTWRAPDLVPARGDAKPMLDHILYLCNGNRAYAAHIADWLAYCVQNPGKKIAHALLLISPAQGVGKDTLALALGRIVGNSNVATIGDSAIEDGRNEFLLRSQLVVVPEIMTGDRKDIANKLKPLITQELIRVNEKAVKPYFVENQANFMMFSNYENAAYIEAQDRRYFVVICRAAPKPTAHYDALYDYIRGDGLAGFAWFLMNRDLSAFNPSARPPETEDKSTVQRATRGGVEAWLDDAYESRASGLRADVINLRDAVADCQQDGAQRMSVQQLAAFLKARGGVDMGPVRLPKRGQTRVWAIRNVDDVMALKPDQLELALTGAAKVKAMTTAARTVAARHGNVIDMPGTAAE